MISKSKIKYLCSLKQKKFRIQNKSTILEGLRLIEQAIDFNANIKSIWILKDRLKENQEFISKAKLKNISLYEINEQELKLISDTKNSQGYIAEVSIDKYLDNTSINFMNNNIVILDNISDPGNIGTILRTCTWYGIKSIILTSHSSDPFNLKCIRSGMGAHFYFDHLIILDNKELKNNLKDYNFEVLCADLDGKDINSIDISKKWALILGSEAHGISKEFKQFDKITIKKHGNIESLNVSVATGIILNTLIKS